MRKLFFVVVLALVGFSCFAAHIEGWHSDYSSCDAYAGKVYSAWYLLDHNTLEKAEAKVEIMVTLSSKAKPYKNEVEAAFDVIEKHYEPQKGEMYHFLTTTKNSSNTVQRHIFIWMDKDDSYCYWVYEQIAG